MQRLCMWVRSPACAVVGTAVVISALAGWSFWQRWQQLDASPFPLGVDGYFYPVQLRSLLEHGQLRYPAAPLAFYLLAPFAAVTDPITGAKLGAAVLGAALAAPAYAVGARLGASRGAGLLAAALATTSAGSMYLTIEFVKNGIGLTVALTALWLALRAADAPQRPSHARVAADAPQRPSRARVAAALAGVAAAYATHKMAAVLVLAVAVPAALGAARATGRLRGRRLIYVIVALALVAALVLAIGALAPQRALSAGDAGLLDGLYSTTPRWTAPALAFPTGELALGHDALLGLGFALAAIAGRWLLRPARTAGVDAAGWPILVLAIAIGLPLLAVTDRQGLGFRLRIAAFVPAALAAAIAARTTLAPLLQRLAARTTLAALVQRLAARAPALAPALSPGWILAGLALVIAVVRQPGDQLGRPVITHPALVAATQALVGRIPPGATVIVPERHIAFMVAWYTGAPVAIRPDGVPAEQRVRLLPLNFIGADSPLDRQLMAARAEPSLIPPLGVHPLHPNGLVLVAEPTWTWLLDHLPPADRAHFAAWPTI